MHEPAEGCYTVHCYSHHEDEPAEEGRFYICCAECGHVYYTARELRVAYRRQVWRIWRGGPRMLFGDQWCAGLAWVLWRLATIRAGKIYFCQECIHDF